MLIQTTENVSAWTTVQYSWYERFSLDNIHGMSVSDWTTLNKISMCDIYNLCTFFLVFDSNILDLMMITMVSLYNVFLQLNFA